MQHSSGIELLMSDTKNIYSRISLSRSYCKGMLDQEERTRGTKEDIDLDSPQWALEETV